MHDEYVDIRGIPTRILTYGQWITEPFQKDKELILIITGNPGMPGFYITFATSLYDYLEKKIPIWIIGHAGHDEPPDSGCKKQIPPIKGNEDIFCLDGQIKHKVEFIEKYIPSDVRVHLIGHSVGAWSILQLLKMPEIKARIHHSYMLFPTIERMKESAAGEIFLERSKSLRGNLLMMLFGFIGYLPHAVRASIVGHFIRKWNLPESYLEDALKGLKTSAIDRMLEMGRDQVTNVYDLDIDTIMENVNHMTFYYGTRDHWVPTQYFHDIKSRIPKIDAHLDTHNMAHAFNIRQGPEMAEIVAKWIANKRPPMKDDDTYKKPSDLENITIEIKEPKVNAQ